MTTGAPLDMHLVVAAGNADGTVKVGSVVLTKRGESELTVTDG